MTDTDDPSQFRQPSALRDGRPLPIRAERADEAPGTQAEVKA
jgi:hypothetical protein